MGSRGEQFDVFGSKGLGNNKPFAVGVVSYDYVVFIFHFKKKIKPNQLFIKVVFFLPMKFFNYNSECTFLSCPLYISFFSIYETIY